MKGKIFLFFSLVLSLSLILSAQVWDEPKVLSMDWETGEIAYYSDNSTYMVWATERNGIKIAFIKSNDGGTTWSEIKELGHPHFFSGDPDIAVDSNNNIYIVYKWSFEWRVAEELFFIKSTNGGEDWTEPIQITFSPYCTVVPSILIGANDVIHVIWNEVIFGTAEPYESIGVFHISSDDGGETWSAPAQIENASQKQDALIDSDDNIYVFGGSTSGTNEIYCFKSEDGGENWTHTYVEHYLFSPAATVDRNDTLHLVSDNYCDTLYYQCSLDRGETWSKPRGIAFLTGIEDWPYNPRFMKDIAVDNNNNNIIVAYQNVCGENYEIYYIRSPNRGRTWIRELKLTNTLGHSLNPKLFIDLNYFIHLLWNENPEGIFDPSFNYIRGFLRGKRKIE